MYIDYDKLRADLCADLCADLTAKFGGPPTEASSQPEPAMTSGEVCSALNCSYSTLLRMEKAGTIKPRRVGKSKRYDRKEIENLVKK